MSKGSSEPHKKLSSVQQMQRVEQKNNQPIIIPDSPPRDLSVCSTCHKNRDNQIYVPGYGFINYCSIYCFNQTL